MKLNGYAKFAWGVTAYNILVILWGAYVRATGSGAGCGSHWPTCNGVIIPRSPQVDTVIEFVHRVTSGLALILVIALLIWAFRRFPSGHVVRRAVIVSFVFILLEALVGAGLVKFGWVAHDTSTERVVVIAVHLINTFVLLAALASTAWFASGGERVDLHGHGASVWWFTAALLGVVLIGVTGAITALGDTLFPAESLAAGVAQDFSPTAHFLVRLRVWHPLVAALVSLYVGFLSLIIYLFRATPRIKRIALGLLVLFGIQLAVGMINLVLLAPVWMQVVHLLFADLAWVALVLLAAANFGENELRQNLFEAAAPANLNPAAQSSGTDGSQRAPKP